jgi:hypothetical protein
MKSDPTEHIKVQHSKDQHSKDQRSKDQHSKDQHSKAKAKSLGRKGKGPDRNRLDRRLVLDHRPALDRRPIPDHKLLDRKTSDLDEQHLRLNLGKLQSRSVRN